MATFTPSFTKQFTNTCQNLKITDTSNYGININDQNYIKEDFPIKKVVLRDIFGITLIVKDLDSNGEASFDLSLLTLNQLYLNITLELSGPLTSYSLGVGAFLPCII